MMLFPKSISLSACLVLPSSGAVVLDYISAASTTSASISPTTTHANVTSDNLEAGPGILASSGASYNWRNWDTGSTNFAAAVAAGDFWTWGFDYTDGATSLTLSTMDIRLDRSASGPDDFEIQASVNGASAISLLTHDFNDSASGVNFTGVDLSGIGALTSGDSVVFTLAAFNSELAAGTFDLENNGGTGIVINGDFTAIPEPSVTTLGLLALLGAFHRKR